MACAGVFSLQPGLTANGFPVWRKDNPRRWLYTGTNGDWTIGVEGANIGEGKDFNTDKGYLCSVHAHGGELPHELEKWQTWGDSQWYPDFTVKFSLQ